MLPLHEPPKKKGHKATNIMYYNEYLYGRIQEDKGIKILQLFKEIKAMGYNGGRSLLYSYLKPYVKQRITGNRLNLLAPIMDSIQDKHNAMQERDVTFCQG